MYRLLIPLSLFIILGALLLRKFCGDRVLRSVGNTQIKITAHDLAEKMLDSMELESVEIKTNKFPWAGASITGEHWLSIPYSITKEHSARALGQAALHVGVYLLSIKNPTAIARRSWAVRFGQVFPIFTTLVVIFALVVTKLPMIWGLTLIIASLSLATCAQFLTLTAELQSAAMACILLEKKRILPRLSDEKAVAATTRAWAWRSIVPGLLSRLMQKPQE